MTMRMGMGMRMRMRMRMDMGMAMRIRKRTLLLPGESPRMIRRGFGVWVIGCVEGRYIGSPREYLHKTTMLLQQLLGRGRRKTRTMAVRTVALASSCGFYHVRTVYKFL